MATSAAQEGAAAASEDAEPLRRAEQTERDARYSADAANANTTTGVETPAAAQVARTQRDVEARAEAAKEIGASAEEAEARAGASQSGSIAVSASTTETMTSIRETTATTRDAVIKRVNATREEVSGIVAKLRTTAAESRGAARDQINELVGNVRKAEAELASSIRELQRAKSDEIASKRDGLLEDYRAFVDAAAKAEATPGAGTSPVTGP